MTVANSSGTSLKVESLKGAFNNRFRDEIDRTVARRGPNLGSTGNVASELL